MIFIDAIVAEMHTRIPQIFIGSIIFDSSEPDETFFVKVDEERIWKQ